MNPTREELLFALALTKPATERAAWLDRECADDDGVPVPKVIDFGIAKATEGRLTG